MKFNFVLLLAFAITVYAKPVPDDAIAGKNIYI